MMLLVVKEMNGIEYHIQDFLSNNSVLLLKTALVRMVLYTQDHIQLFFRDSMKKTFSLEYYVTDAIGVIMLCPRLRGGLRTR